MTQSLFSVSNLTSQNLAPCLPWEFKAERPSAQICGDKQSRQDWYRSASTAWNYYTGIEPCNSSQRISKNNPPRAVHAIVGDFDMPLTDERIREAVATMKLPPSWIERSLGGHCRLVWILARPLLVDSNEFAVFVLQQAVTWLQVDLLPGRDTAAWEDPARLFCNGASWVNTGHGLVPENDCQAFFVKCGLDYNFKPLATTGEIPLDIVEKALIEKFPNFRWPVEFAVDSQGPSFWIEGSTSAMSAICKRDGFFSFAAHAEKPFYFWSDILGPEFAKQYETNSTAEATKDLYFDGKAYWRFVEHEGRYISESREVLLNHLKVNCRVSAKPGKDGISMQDKCLAHIHAFGRVEGGAPLLFQKPGLVIYNNTKLVNTSPRSHIIIPSGVESAWGPSGNFPFISSVLDALFEPPEQLQPFLAWLQWFFLRALAQTPSPGQNLFFVGGAGTGKTLTNREIIGGLMGGHVDASRHMLGDSAFNSSLFSAAVWSIDDETIGDSDAAHRRFSSYLKMCCANQSFEYRRKFEHNVMIFWSGRIVCTMNADCSSSRMLPNLDESNMQKLSFFKCASTAKIVFPDREIIRRLLKSELPNLGQWLTAWKTPPELLGEARYGVRAYHEPTLIQKSHQAGRSAPFKEILVEALTQFFSESNAAEWRGSCTQLTRFLHSNPLNEPILRSLKLEQINRHLEALSREGVLTCRSETGDRQTRIWIFDRFASSTTPPQALEIPPMANGSIFTR